LSYWCLFDAWIADTQQMLHPAIELDLVLEPGEAFAIT
jgi:hypothetical protein